MMIHGENSPHPFIPHKSMGCCWVCVCVCVCVCVRCVCCNLTCVCLGISCTCKSRGIYTMAACCVHLLMQHTLEHVLCRVSVCLSLRETPPLRVCVCSRLSTRQAQAVGHCPNTT